MSDAGLLLGIDGGQTSTKAMLATLDGVILSTGLGGPSDHFHIEGGVEKNRAAIHAAIASALDAAGRSGAEIAAVGLGLTGAPPEGKQNPVVERLVIEKLPNLTSDRISVNPDYKTNLLGASGGKPGVVLIAGGGCISYGITVDGREGIAGGYGFLLGDQGSAFHIGLRAIDAATKSDDLRGPRTALEETVREHFGLERIRLITRVVYAAGFSRERISLLTPKVVMAAERGDQIARGILADAAHDAAETALGVVRQLFEPGEAVPIYRTGGVFGAGDLHRAPFEAALSSGWPGAEAVEPRFPPAVGALIAGAKLAGVEVDDDWLGRVASSIAGLQEHI